MKVISIQEPFGTLILKKHKRVETRSWKTNYRGELYIHTSSSLFKGDLDKAFMYVSKDELSFGYIICKCRLVDCIEMTDDFINSIKDTKEYDLGIYEVGRYAWILDDIEPIDKIKAKGKLNIWEYKGDEKNEL